MDKKNIFLEYKEREENIWRRKILFVEEKKNREEKGRKISWRRKNFVQDGLTGIKVSTRGPRRSKNAVINSSYERRDIEKQMLIAKSAKNLPNKDICNVKSN